MNKVSFFKRMVVVVYDALLMVGVTLVGYAVLFAILSVTPEGFGSSSIGKVAKVIYLLGAPFAFYGWFWTHGGQTLGMKVWNLYVLDRQGRFISWNQAALRYAIALISWAGIAGALYLADVERWYLAIGLGFTWMLTNKRKLAWHDILSGTQILQTPKTEKTNNK